MANKPLTAVFVKNAKSKINPKTNMPFAQSEYSDGSSGLTLIISGATGLKRWQFSMMIKGRRVKETIGLEKDIPLASAREMADEIRRKYLNNEFFKENDITFEKIWFEFDKIKSETVASKTYERNQRYYKKYLYKLNAMPMKNIGKKEIMDAIKPIIDEGKFGNYEKCISLLSSLFEYAILKEACNKNIAKELNTKNSKKNLFGADKMITKNHPALIHLDDVLALKSSFESYCAKDINIPRLALFALYTAVRPSEAREATWQEIDLEHGEWTISDIRSKARKSHTVVLSTQLVELLKRIKKENNPSKDDFVFLGEKDKCPISDGAVMDMIKKVGFGGRVDGHGFRATFATIANNLSNEHGFTNDIIQACLAHVINTRRVFGAYNHADYKAQCAKLWQWWADKLGDIKI